MGEEGNCIPKKEDTKSPPKCPENLINPCKDNMLPGVPGEQEEPLDEEDMYNMSISIIEDKIKSLENTNKELKNIKNFGKNVPSNWDKSFKELMSLIKPPFIPPF